MKMIAAVPFALLTLGVLGCSQQASTAPAVVQPPAESTGEKNMFGESKDEAAGSAANARAAAYGAPADSAATSSAAAGSTPPK